MNHQYTEKELIVKKLRDEGNTYKTIAGKIGVSENRAKQIYDKAKIKEKYLSLYEGYINGESIECLASKYNLLIPIVESIVKRIHKQKVMQSAD